MDSQVFAVIITALVVHSLWIGAMVAAIVAAALRTISDGHASLRYWLSGTGLLVTAVISGFAAFNAVPQMSRDTAMLVATAGVLSRANAILLSLSEVIAIAWSTGAAVQTTAALRGIRQLSVLRRSSVALSDSGIAQTVIERLERIRSEFTTTITAEIRLSAMVAAPLTFGFLRAVILLPASLVTRIPPGQLEALVLHELAHVRRFDYQVNAAQVALECVFFFNPPVLWLSRQMRRERELCCDDVVLGSAEARDYARALFAAATVSRQNLPAPAAAGGELPRRIERILEGPRPSRAMGPALAGMLVLVFSAVGLAATAPSRPGGSSAIPAVAPPVRKAAPAAVTSSPTPVSPDQSTQEARIQTASRPRESAPPRPAAAAGLDHLIDDLSDSRWYVRERAVQQLAATDAKGATAGLVKALDDENWAIREMSIQALAKRRERSAVEPLIRKTREDRSWSVRALAAHALAKIGDPRAAPALKEAAADENSSVRQAAHDALATFDLN